MSKRAKLQKTQMREFYDALKGLSQGEEMALAEFHLDHPERIASRFAHAVKTVEAYPPITEPFHERGEDSGTSKPRRGSIEATRDFAAYLDDGQVHSVSGPDGIHFRYVDREIFPLRTALPSGPRPDPRTLDLLLVSDEGRPIIGELKIRGDSLPYYALIQSLMYAAEMSSPSQQQRLTDCYGDRFDLRNGDASSLLDIFLIFVDPPPGSYRQSSMATTVELSGKLMEDDRVSGAIGHIAYIDAELDLADESLLWRQHRLGPAREA